MTSLRIIPAFVVACWLAPAAGFAQTEPLEAVAPAEPTPANVFELLVALGDGVDDLDSYKDNQFLYEERSEQLYRDAAQLVGREVDLAATVMRVSDREVIVHVPDAGETRLLLRHDVEPEFGNICTVRYFDGYPSTDWYHQFSGPTAMRIGSEIDIEIARQLRRNDRLIVRGQLLSVTVRVKSIFNPVAVAIVTGWQVVEVQEAESDSYVALP